MELMRLILEYGAVCWDPYREGHVSALYQVQKRVAKFTYYNRVQKRVAKSAYNMSWVGELWHSVD